LDGPPVLYGNFYLRKLLNRGDRGTRGYRDDREGGALRAQVLDSAFGSHLCRGENFPHWCRSSPHPLRGSSPIEGSLSEVVKRHWSRECFVGQSHMCFQPGRALELDGPPVLYGNFYLRKLLNRGYRGTRGYRDYREGGALRAQVLDSAFGSHLCRGKFSSLVQVVPSPAFSLTV